MDIAKKKDNLISSPISRGNDLVTVLWEKQISNAGDSSRRISKMPYKVEKFPKEVKKSLKVKRMCHGGTKHQRTTRTEHFTQRRTRLRTISPFGKPKVPGRGGKTGRRRTGNLEFLQRRRKGLQAYRFLQKGKNFFFKKPVSDGKSDKVTKTK